MLLNFEADSNAQMMHDTTATHIAAAGGWVVGIDLIRKAGALVNARDAMLHETPLHKATRILHLNYGDMVPVKGREIWMVRLIVVSWIARVSIQTRRCIDEMFYINLVQYKICDNGICRILPRPL